MQRQNHPGNTLIEIVCVAVLPVMVPHYYPF